MTESTDAENLQKLKKIVKTLEERVNECKAIIDSIESATFKATNLKEPKLKDSKIPSVEVLKIAEEFKRERKSEALIWLTSGNNVKLPELKDLLRENGYLIPPKTTKKNMQSAVEQILIERYTF